MQVASGSNMTLTGITISSKYPAANLHPSLAPAALNLKWENSGTQLPGPLFGVLLPDYLSFRDQPVLPANPNSLAVMTLMHSSIVFNTCSQGWVDTAKQLSLPSGVRCAALAASFTAIAIISCIVVQHSLKLAADLQVAAPPACTGSGMPCSLQMVTCQAPQA